MRLWTCARRSTPWALCRCLGAECWACSYARLTLTYLRHNPPREMLAGGATASGRPPPPASSAYTPQIASGLEGSVSTVEDLDPAAQLIIDGPLFQGWSWKVALRCTPVCTRPQD